MSPDVAACPIHPPLGSTRCVVARAARLAPSAFRLALPSWRPVFELNVCSGWLRCRLVPTLPPGGPSTRQQPVAACYSAVLDSHRRCPAFSAWQLCGMHQCVAGPDLALSLLAKAWPAWLGVQCRRTRVRLVLPTALRRTLRSVTAPHHGARVSIVIATTMAAARLRRQPHPRAAACRRSGLAAVARPVWRRTGVQGYVVDRGTGVTPSEWCATAVTVWWRRCCTLWTTASACSVGGLRAWGCCGGV